MFALVANGAVNAVSKVARTVSGGQWLPMVEDPATYSPYEDQVPDRYTITGQLVTRHWRTLPKPPTRADVDELRTGIATVTLNTSGRESGAPWVQPIGYQDAYPAGWLVSHNGKTWVATQDGAAGEPGGAGWREVVPEGVVPDWVQPHAGEEYPPGAQVKHNGHLWTNVHTGPNGWEPGTTGSQWRDDGPVA